jgi:cation-transporting P-type ATPase 13A2
MNIHDYTEGATATDIEAALANSHRSRRDSQSTHDVSGSMFDGPGHTIVPSSVSRMSTLDRGMRDRHSREWSRSRRRSNTNPEEDHEAPRVSRRISTDSQAVESDYMLSDEDHSGLVASSSSMRGRKTQRRPLRSPSLHKSGVLENIANIFSRSTVQDDRRSIGSRRSSMHSRGSRSRSDAGSRRSATTSDEEDGDERWGYSSGEEDNSDSDLDAVHAIAKDDDGASFSASELEYDSNPPSPRASLPLLSADPIFGNEARIDMEGMPLGPSEPPPPGPPSRQNVFVADEDTTVLLVGFETIKFRQYIWYLGCILSFGILALLGHWFPRFWLRWVAQEKAFKDLDHGFIVVEVCL